MHIEPIIMTVVFQALPGKEEELRKALSDVVAPTRREEGCLFYDLHVAEGDSGRFLFHESWATQAHHAAHDQTPHIQALRARMRELSAPQVKTWWEKIA
jgi:quinol monooxygenase YgiN